MDVCFEPIAFVSHVSCTSAIVRSRKHLCFLGCRRRVHPRVSSDRARSTELRAPRLGILPSLSASRGRRLHRTCDHGVCIVRLGRVVSRVRTFGMARKCGRAPPRTVGRVFERITCGMRRRGKNTEKERTRPNDRYRDPQRIGGRPRKPAVSVDDEERRPMNRMDRRSLCGPWGRREGSDGGEALRCIGRPGLNRRGSRERPPPPASPIESDETDSHGSSEGGECYRGGWTGPGRGCSSDDRTRTGLGDTLRRRGYGNSSSGFVRK